MRDDAEFNIEFVQLVQSYPCLYDYSRPDYNRNIQDQAWKLISAELNNVSVSELKDRWKNLRGRFTKYLKAKKDKKEVRPYYLYENLHFLVKFTKTRSAKYCGNLMKTTFEKADESMYFEPIPTPSQQNRPNIEGYYEDGIIVKTELPQNQNNASKRLKRKIETYEDVVYLENECKKRANDNSKVSINLSEFDNMDPDAAFLYSVLHDMKKMSEKQKIQYKLSILKLTNQFTEATCEEADSSRL